MFRYTNFNPFQPPKPEPAKKPEQPKPPAGPPAPPRMAIMVCNGKEVMVALPQSHDKALAAAVAAFEVPNTYATRLAVKDIPPWLQKFNAGDILFMYVALGFATCSDSNCFLSHIPVLTMLRINTASLGGKLSDSRS
jgi:hypothetical protein